jgi:hypothetical protein
MGVDERVARFLKRRATEAFCRRCLGEQVGIEWEEARRASIDLRRWPGYHLEIGVCSACRRSGLVVQASDGVPLGTTPRLALFLIHHSGRLFCDRCLAGEADCDMSAAARARGRLLVLPEFVTARGRCDGCGRRTTGVKRIA